MGLNKLNLGFKIPILITAIIVLAVYFYLLDTVPPGFYSDEAVVGYNAYSIWKTGRDEYGQPFPIYFKFFGSYTPGLFVYFLSPFVGILGTKVMVVRGVNVLLMLITGFILLKFIQLLKIKLSWWQPPIILLFYWLTPWTFFNGRLGYETTFGYFWFCLSAYCLLKSLLNSKYYWLSIPLLSLLTYTAHPYRYLVPILFVLFYLFFRPPIKSIIKPLIIALIIQIPNFYLTTTSSFWVKNSYLNWQFIYQYLTFFSPFYLFSSTDPDLQRSLPELSILYFWQFIPLIIGIKQLFKLPHRRLILLLILVSPLPASFANANFATQRALSLLFPYSILISIGIVQLLKTKLGIIVNALLIPLSFLLLWRSYFVLFPPLRAKQWYAGFDLLSQYIKDNPNQHFLVDDSRHIPHIEFLFFNQYPPAKYQLETGKLSDYYNQTSFVAHRKFSNIEIRPIVWEKDVYIPQIIVGDLDSISVSQATEHCLELVFEAHDSKGNLLLHGYKTHPERKLNNCIIP